MKTLQEDGGAEIVDAVHYLVTEKLVSSSKWQEETSSSDTIAFEDLWNGLMASLELRNDNTLDAVTNLISTHARDIKMPNFVR